MPAEHLLACDLGGTRMRVALVSYDGLVGDKEVVLTPDSDPDSLVRIMYATLNGAKEKVTGVVLGVPGMVNYAKGQVVKLPNLPAWEGSINASHLTKALGLNVLIANDADLGALGEHRFGAGRGTKDMVYVTASTGVGSGVILNGRLLYGKFSLGEIGHTIIDRTNLGTVETLASGIALARSTGQTASQIASHATAGDEEARRLFDQVATDLAIGVYNLVHCFSPELVVVGGGMAKTGDMLLDPMRALLKQAGPYRLASSVRVVKAEAGDDVGLKGAAAFWTDHQQG